jgi:hypothetical protein
MSDLERIKKNLTTSSKKEEINDKKIIEDQKELAYSSAQVKNQIFYL